MSEPSLDDIYRADPYLAVQDMKAAAAASGQDFNSFSDAKLNKLADDYNVDVSQMQSQYSGVPGFGGKRIAQKTFAQLIRGDQEQKPRSTEALGPSAGAAPVRSKAPLGPSVGASPESIRGLPPAAFETKDYSSLLQEKLAEMDLQREQAVVPDSKEKSTSSKLFPNRDPMSGYRTQVMENAAPALSLSETGRAIAERSTNFVERIKNFLDDKNLVTGARTSVVDTPPSMSSEEKEMLREALGVGEEISESLIERVGNLFTNLLPTREDMISGMSPLELPRTGLELQRAATENKRSRTEDMTASLQDEMARMRTLKEIEKTGLTSPEQTNVVDRDEFNTTPIGTRLRLLAEENLRRNQEAKEAIKKEEGTPPKRPVSPRVLDSAAKRFEATLEAPRQEQEGTRLSFADIVEKRTRNAPKTGAAIADNEAQVGKAGSADRASQTNIIKDYLNSMGYSKQDQTKFAKYFFNTFDQDVFFNQDVIIAALKMFNKEN